MRLRPHRQTNPKSLNPKSPSTRSLKKAPSPNQPLFRSTLNSMPQAAKTQNRRLKLPQSGGLAGWRPFRPKPILGVSSSGLSLGFKILDLMSRSVGRFGRSRIPGMAYRMQSFRVSGKGC